MMRVLITGGAGFIGSHLAEALLARGGHISILDDLSTGSLSNVGSIVDDPRVVLVEGCVMDEILVEGLVARSDVVIHLAAAVGVKLVMENPLDSFTRNVRGTEVVVQSAERHGVKVLVASTSEVYGKNALGVFAEDSDFVYGPTSVTRWSYALSKATDEVLAHYHYVEKGLPTVIMRFFNTVGPRQSADFGMVLPRLVHQALSGAPLTVYGDGLQTRSFCHVADTVDAIIALMEEPGAVGGTFNVGSPNEVAIIDAARIILAKTGSCSTIELVPFSQAYGPGFEDVARRVPDIGKISSLTGWRPTRSLDEILNAVIEATSESINDTV